MLDALTLHGALDATLAAVPAELLAGLLQHVRRQLSRPAHAATAIAVAHSLLSSCPGSLALGGDGGVGAQLADLRGAVIAELRTQEQMLVLRGMVGGLLHAT